LLRPHRDGAAVAEAGGFEIEVRQAGDASGRRVELDGLFEPHRSVLGGLHHVYAR
jgi:hypothetical protein